MACGMEAKGREVEDGRREEWRGEMEEAKRGALVWFIGSIDSIEKKAPCIISIFLFLHVGEAALLATNLDSEYRGSARLGGSFHVLRDMYLLVIS
jgi:hypothetical protein